jgi:hypothetical protein
MMTWRIPLPEHWTPAQAEAAIELLELALLDIWEQYDHAIAQLRHRYGLALDDDHEQEPRESTGRDPDDDISF